MLESSAVTCKHVWWIDMKAVDGVFPAVCKICHERRDFSQWPKVSRMGQGARRRKIEMVD